MNSAKAGKMGEDSVKAEIQELLEDIRDCERIITSQVQWIEKCERRLRELGYGLPDKLREQVKEKLRESINIPKYTIVKQVSAEDIKYSAGIEEYMTKLLYNQLGTYLRNIDENVQRTEHTDGSVQLKIEYIIMTPKKLVDVITEIMR